jgi:Sulfotransferase family
VRGPIFIVSPMGTGSTLLRLILDSHEHIAVPHETAFMRIYSAMRYVPFKLSGREWAKRLGWSDEELDEEARRFFDRIFMRYAEQHGKRRWGDKTPQHTWHVAKIMRVFPDAVFVGIVRHPGAAVASNMRRFGHSLRFAISHYERYAKEIARQAGMHHDRVIILRYEDLVQSPEPVMRELLDWLGEPWSDNVLGHHVVQGQRFHHRVEGLSRADEPINTSRIASWAKEVSEADQQLITRRLTRIAEFYGYSFEDLAALSSLSESESLLFGGPEVDERIERFPDLELPIRGDVPLPERFYHPRKVELILNPYGRPRFLPGQPDAAAPPPPGPVRRTLGKTVSVLPAPARLRVRQLARKVGIKPPRRELPTPLPLDE